MKDIYDITEAVQREMNRAAKIHGAEFESIRQATEAITEEWLEVVESIYKGDVEHARVEIIQMIGTLVKLYWGLEKLVEVKA